MTDTLVRTLPIVLTEDDVERVLRRLAAMPIQFDSCWTWTGASDGRYGKVHVGSTMRLVHRVTWTMFVGPIPEGLTLDHLCRNTFCCRPTHLEPVTHRVNVLRGEALSAVHAAVTHCPQGHEYDLLNTYWTLYGSRACRACKRERDRAYRAAKKQSKAESSLSTEGV